MLGPRDPLDPMPRRMLVAGASGTGKTTLGRRVDEVLGLPHTEIDALFHGPEWSILPGFVEEVDAFTAAPAWVTEWQYASQLGDLLPSRADTVVWLDLRAATHMTRLVRRTLSRRFRRTELWNGNVEPPLRTILTDPEHIIRWGWKSRRTIAARVLDAEREHPALRIVRLRSQRDIEAWVATLAAAATAR